MKKKFCILLPLASLFLLAGCDGVSILKKHCTLKFYSNGGTDVNEQKIDVFTVPVEPADPYKKGYDFLGWYYDNNTFEYRFNFEQKLCQDVKLYAKWSPTAPVIFNSTTLYTNELSSPHGYDYVAKIRLKDDYKVDNCFSLPTQKAYYKVRIGGVLYENFNLQTSHEGDEDVVKIIIPHTDITGTIEMQAEAYEKYLTFTNNLDSEITLTRNLTGLTLSDWSYYDIEIGSGTPPEMKTWASDSNDISIPIGHKLQILATHANTLSTSKDHYLNFSTSAPLVVSGDITSLIDHNSLTDYCFYNLFNGFKFAGNVRPVLPSYDLAQYCYFNMFYHATGLFATPILPAEEVKANAYNSMFEGCDDTLIIAEMAAKTLNNGALWEMFKDTKVKMVTVNFGSPNSTTWPSASNVTDNWLPNRTPDFQPIFVWKGTTNMFEIEKNLYNVNKIPTGWLVTNPS